LQHTFLDPNNTSGDHFGYSIAISGNYVLVGSPGANGSKGEAYLFNINTPNQWLYFLDPNGTANDSFGSSVALSGNDMLVGAPYANGYLGATYLYNTSGQELLRVCSIN